MTTDEAAKTLTSFLGMGLKLDDSVREEVAQVVRDLAALRQCHAEVVKAFRAYADHEDGCAHVDDFSLPCTCGFADANARLT